MALETKASVAVDSLTDLEAGEILRDFGYEPEEVVRLYGGYASSNFKVVGRKSSGDGEAKSTTLLLKVNHYSISVEDLRHQILVMRHLQTAAFPTNYAHAAPSGEYVLESHGRRALLLDFIGGSTPGSKLLSEDESRAPALLSELGATLAQLHLVTWPDGQSIRDVRSGYPVCNTGDLLQGGELEKLEANPAVAGHEFLGYVRSCTEWLRALYARDVPWGLIHGDGFLDNTLFADGAKECKLLALIDWEDSCVGPFVLDLAVCASACCFTATNELVVDRLQCILAAYVKRRSLSALELDSLADFMAAGALACGFYRFCEFNVRQPESKEEAKGSYKIMFGRAKLLKEGTARGAVEAAVKQVQAP